MHLWVCFSSSFSDNVKYTSSELKRTFKMLLNSHIYILGSNFDLKIIIKILGEFVFFNKQNCFILNDCHNYTRILVNINLRSCHLNVKIIWMFFHWSKNKLCKWNLKKLNIFNPLTPRGDYSVPSPYSIHTLHSKQVARILKLIRYSLLPRLNTKFS